jgi:glucan phosphoethanolaminetransferase (alkaline phosphatase superfamily)
MAGGARLGSFRHALFAAWLALLVLPAVTVFYWRDPHHLLTAAVALGCFALLWVVFGARWFFVVTYPFALVSVLAIGAEALRHVDLLELALFAGRVDLREADRALSPYYLTISAVALVLAVLAALGFRRPAHHPSRRARAAASALIVLPGIAMGFARPALLLRAWPVNVASAGLAFATRSPYFATAAVPWAPTSPRSRQASWAASRDAAPARRETYVVLIGESIRADHLAACGGPASLGLDPDAVVYCDVMAGASSTHVSVPLLVSRRMPGSPARVGSDATFLRAFEEAGFRTYWLSAQDESIAWPDAQVSRYVVPRSTDRRDLLPLLREALADPAPKKAIVIHSYDAHFPYCERFDPRDAPFPVDCRKVGAIPQGGERRDWIAAYDDAVAETVRYIDAVIAQLSDPDGEAFVAYTPDHGENLLDDGRGLYFHALREPTRYDTRVPMVFWANSTWRAAHPDRLRGLVAHRAVPAMQADLVPTVLGAAGIRYAEPRGEVVDLTRRAPGKRVRWVSPRPGERVDGDRLP